MSSGIYSSSSLLLSEDTDHAVLGVASDSLSDSSESSESSEEDEAFEYSGDDGYVAILGDCAGVDETDAIRFW